MLRINVLGGDYMILAFWLECFLDAWSTIDASGLSKQQKDEVMIWYVN